MTAVKVDGRVLVDWQARRAVSRVQDAVITAQIQTVDEPLAAAMTALDQCVREIEEITSARREA